MVARLSKRVAAAHREACALAGVRRDLTEEEKRFVLTHFQESTYANQAVDGAFFTPPGWAGDMSIEVVGSRILDLGAGIGALAFACRDLWGRANGDPPRELVCVERNPDFVRIGRKIVPEARWWCGDLLHIDHQAIRPFDTVIANPPFGRAGHTSTALPYRGSRLEYSAIAVAARVARHGVFLVPQTSAPFRYSGYPRMDHDSADTECRRFQSETGILLEPNCGIDTSYYRDQWHHQPIAMEVVTCDFTDLPRYTARSSTA